MELAGHIDLGAAGRELLDHSPARVIVVYVEDRGRGNAAQSLGERIKAWAHRSDNRIEELAHIVTDRAKALGVSVARYLEKLQKHLLQYLISTYLLDPIPIKLPTGPSTLGAASVNLQATVTLQPSVSAGADVVQGFVASLFNMSFQLTVGYAPASPA